jgi:hypothetical protein
MKTALTVLTALTALMAFAVLARAADWPLLPDDKLTPGVIATLDTDKVCRPGYSDTVRKTTAAQKAQAFKLYGLTNKPGPDFEVDHRIPLSIGGADAAKNRWPQSYLTSPWNAHIKDRLEFYVHQRVCVKKTMTLLEGQRLFQGNWIAAYREYLGKP